MKRVSFVITDDDLNPMLMVLVPYIKLMQEFRVTNPEPTVAGVRTALPAFEAPLPAALERFHKKQREKHPRRKYRKPATPPQSREPIRAEIRTAFSMQEVLTPLDVRTIARECGVPNRTVHNVLFQMKRIGEIESFRTVGASFNSYRLTKQQPEEAA